MRKIFLVVLFAILFVAAIWYPSPENPPLFGKFGYWQYHVTGEAGIWLFQKRAISDTSGDRVMLSSNLEQEIAAEIPDQYANMLHSSGVSCWIEYDGDPLIPWNDLGMDYKGRLIGDIKDQCNFLYWKPYHQAVRSTFEFVRMLFMILKFLIAGIVWIATWKLSKALASVVQTIDHYTPWL